MIPIKILRNNLLGLVLMNENDHHLKYKAQIFIIIENVSSSTSPICEKI